MVFVIFFVKPHQVHLMEKKLNRHHRNQYIGAPNLKTFSFLVCPEINKQFQYFICLSESFWMNLKKHWKSLKKFILITQTQEHKTISVIFKICTQYFYFCHYLLQLIKHINSQFYQDWRIRRNTFFTIHTNNFCLRK